MKIFFTLLLGALSTLLPIIATATPYEIQLAQESSTMNLVCTFAFSADEPPALTATISFNENKNEVFFQSKLHRSAKILKHAIIIPMYMNDGTEVMINVSRYAGTAVMYMPKDPKDSGLPGKCVKAEKLF